MPSGDRTGPMGQGSMTGKALGFCEGNETPGYHRGFGAGMGRGFGFGRGMSRGRGFGFGRYWNWFSAGLLFSAMGHPENFSI
ncbi:DUF5320 domain-containing protein [Gaoshiqia sediminis]|uniref:DUF5320 domain-containing protein n=1 Tax=Gaoshiqia sediminis TaxID=2986998 RepID=A0AA42CB85_9BACT|nr:DUF5320 domain-containing protein [Gaoshiqia sediminis]MCW0484907.1 DUF5320 domain-containing protein [Gaoshiqia sediminis]